MDANVLSPLKQLGCLYKHEANVNSIIKALGDLGAVENITMTVSNVGQFDVCSRVCAQIVRGTKIFI